MAMLQMHIDKFGRVVRIDEDHPLAVEQRAKDAAVKADTRKARGPAATRTSVSQPLPTDVVNDLFSVPPEQRDVPAVQEYLEGLSYAELQAKAKEHEGIAANQSRDDLVVLLTIALTTPVAE